jgi:predicted transcriptional regulator
VVLQKTISVTDHEACGREVRIRRKSAGMTLATLAGKIGVSISYLSALELGRRNWTEDLWGKCDEAFSDAGLRDSECSPS